MSLRCPHKKLIQEFMQFYICMDCGLKFEVSIPKKLSELFK